MTDLTRPVKVGDVVTWRGKAKSDKYEPLGVANCKVLEIGETSDGEPAALIEALGQQVGARLSDLYLEA